MSLIHEVIAWDFELPGLKKLTLLHLARSVHRTTREAKLSVRKIARACGTSESAVRKYVAELALDGFVEVIPAARGALHYRLTIDSKAPV